MAHELNRPILLLPVELKQAIMSAIPDLPSLRSTVLSCSSFYDAFQSAESLITTAVLCNQLDPSLLPEAIAAHESSRLVTYDRESISKFVANYLVRRSSPNSWALTDALSIGRLHVFVQYLAERFASANLARKPPFEALNCPRPTQSEICRIERAFYRFEIYCNLFRSYSAPSEEARRDLYFSNFSPCENEQLSCIHDFLIQAVALAFNDVVEHDISWGALRVPYIDRLDSVQGEHLLSYGLESLYHIVQAETYDARHKLLHRGNERNDEPLQRDDFLYQDLWWIASPEFNGSETLSQLTQEGKDIYVKSSFYNDPDPGPAKVWWWAHQSEMLTSIVGVPKNKPYRRWGYVLWDISRLENIGIFKEPHGEPKISKDELDEFRQEDRRRSLRESWEKREKIWRAGGTGWWSFQDQSKVVWPPRRKQEHLYINTKSVNEAKEFLRGLKLPVSQRTLRHS